MPSKHGNLVKSDLSLRGNHVRLEQLSLDHIEGLVKAANADPLLYRWSRVPQDTAAATKYVETALLWKHAGTALPFAIIRVADEAIIGSTRLWNMESWDWPPSHPRHDRAFPDACEIGHTWLTQSAVRTPVNTEAKLLMLTHAFEAWQVFRVCFHADVRNERSRAALERIGAQFEGILRSHRMAVDCIPRDSARYSILASEWPKVKCGLEARLARG
ncbi:MAG TPA: GNAT family protein [Candidatus Angelobacter sp.]|nr:GNAT family protein [Candidatus Angelobacter sp.]